jgi:hypothetical protein
MHCKASGKAVLAFLPREVVGEVVGVDVVIQNVGNQGVTADITVALTDDTDSVLIGSQSINGGLTAGASGTLVFSWDTSASSRGQHTLRATQDFADDETSNDSASTTVSVNEPGTGISVTAIDPTFLPASSATEVTISGSGFAIGATVAFENGAGPVPAASGVTVVDATTITASVMAKSGGPPKERVRDVRVTNPDGSSAVLLGGFTVTP